MQVHDLPLAQLKEAPWNPNRMDGPMLAKLQQSIREFGLVQNLVVRPVAKDTYEVLSGNQRLKVLRDLGLKDAPCVVVHADDAHARLLAQALNRIQGEDDLGLKAELIREVLGSLGKDDMLNLLPETEESIQALLSLGQESMEEHLQAWQQAQGARLRHLAVQLTDQQLRTVEEALAFYIHEANGMKQDNPNIRGNALYLVCRHLLQSRQGQGDNHE